MAKTTNRSRKSAESAALTLGMATTATGKAGKGSKAAPVDPALSELLALLGDDDTLPQAGAPDEVIEDKPLDEAPAAAGGELVSLISSATPDVGTKFSDSELAALVNQAESVEASISAATPEVGDGSVSGDGSDVTPGEDAAAAADAPKRERTPRKHYTNKADRIADRLGDKLSEYTVLTVDDAAGALDEAALQAKMIETMEVIRKMNQKCQNRASLFMEFVSGKKAKLNEVIERALRVLAADGKITTGKDGNLLANLLAKPYSPAAARAMGGNTVSMLEDLKVLVADGKGVYKGNPDSLLLAKANALLGISTAS